MNILEVNTFQSNTGGQEIFVQKLSNELAKKNKVSIISTENKEQPFSIINPMVKKIELKVWRRFFDDIIPLLSAAKTIKTAIKTHEILHIHNPLQLVPILVLLINFNSKKTICTFHGKNETIEFPKNIINKFRTILVLQVIYCFSDYFVFLTHSDSQYFGSKFFLPIKKKTLAIGNGCDTSFFSTKDGPKPEQSKSFVVLFVGRLSINKGVKDILTAAHDLGDKNILFKFVGKGKLEYLVLKEKKTVLLGHLSPDKLREEYENCDVLVLPSYSEGFPNVILEAMSMGKPIIASNIYGIPEIVKDGVNGFLISPGDVNALKEAIILLRDNPKQREEMGSRNEFVVRKDYDWGIIAGKYEDLFSRGL